MDPLIWQLLLQAALIGLNAVFACAEIAVISMNDARLSMLSQTGDPRALRLTKLTGQPSRFLATIQVAITLSGFLGSAFAADHFADRIVTSLLKAGVSVSADTLNTVCVILITLILSYFTLVFGELVPKRVAMQNSEKLALSLSGLLTGISAAFRPLVSLLSVSTNAMLRLLHIDPDAHEDTATEENIRMMIDMGSEKGSIDAAEKRMLQNIFEFDDVTAGELATHRTLVTVLWQEDSDERWAELIHDTRYSHYPVCGESADDVLGVLNAKDYYRLPDRSRERVLREAVSEAHFVPASVKADVLFADMRKHRNYFAVVLDEYGGVEGVVTMKDLLEEIVGDLNDSDDGSDPLFEPLGDGGWRMSGSVPLDAVTDALHVELPTDDFETLAGLVFSAFSAVPKDGSQFTCRVSGLEIEVRRLRRHRIEEAVVRVIAAEPPTEPQAEPEAEWRM